MSDDARRIRAALADPLDVARRLGLLDGAKRQARGVLVRCPNGHDKRAPSCSLTTGADDTLRVRCFGCGLAGDAFTLVAACDGLDARRDFRAVFLRAAELAGVEASGPSTSRKEGAPAPSPRRAPLPPAHDAARFDALARAILTAGNLDAPSSADVASYLDARGLLALARADGWGALPSFASLDVDPAELRASGLVLPSGEGWTHPAHRLCIPWRGLDGAIATIQRRRCDAAEGDRYALPSGRAPVVPYGAEALARAPSGAAIVIVEGAADVLAARALARGPIVALGVPGVGAWRASWATLATGRRALVALDADAAGDRAADVLARDLAAAGAVEVCRVRPPSGAKDWCDALASAKQAA